MRCTKRWPRSAPASASAPTPCATTRWGRPPTRRPVPGRARAAQVWTGPPATLLHQCAAVQSSAVACSGPRCFLPPRPKLEQQKVRMHSPRGSAQSSKVCACRCASSSA
jgi:hypothetical protein